jgi:hypothetical protein
MTVSRLIEFYLGEVPDSEGRTIHDILNFDLRQLEDVHNYLRITRILTSVRLLGLEEYAEAFYEALGNVYKEYASRIGPETWGYWTNAAGKR